MKKLLLPLILILMLSSCAPRTVDVVPDFNLNTAMSVHYLDGDYVFNTKTAENGRVTMEITEPEILRGITLDCSADGIFARCGDVSVGADNGYLPFSNLYKVLCFAKGSVPNAVTPHNNDYRIEYGNDEKYYIVADENGVIKEINTPLANYKRIEL